MKALLIGTVVFVSGMANAGEQKSIKNEDAYDIMTAIEALGVPSDSSTPNVRQIRLEGLRCGAHTAGEDFEFGSPYTYTFCEWGTPQDDCGLNDDAEETHNANKIHDIVRAMNRVGVELYGEGMNKHRMNVRNLICTEYSVNYYSDPYFSSFNQPRYSCEFTDIGNACG